MSLDNRLANLWWFSSRVLGELSIVGMDIYAFCSIFADSDLVILANGLRISRVDCKSAIFAGLFGLSNPLQ